MFIPYNRQSINQDDIDAVIQVLKSDFLTQGPKVEEFEERFALKVGAKYAVAVSSGTAALHSVIDATGIEQGDEVILPSMTFVATANSIIYQLGTPVFADIDPNTLLIDINDVKKKMTDNTRVIIGVDYAGQSCDWEELKRLTKGKGIWLIADSCHSLGAYYKNRPVGSLADITCFSFHAIKNITTGEGGMITTDNRNIAIIIKEFRNHGRINGLMESLGYNCRLTDFQSALGISQLKRLDEFIKKRQQIANRYDQAFRDIIQIRTLEVKADRTNAYHLYVIKTKKRDELKKYLLEKRIETQINYFPVHLQPYYQRVYKTEEGMCPISEIISKEILSLPIYPDLKESEQEYIIERIKEFFV